MIVVYKPFKAYTDKVLQLESLLQKVVSAYGTPDYLDPDYRDYYYDAPGIGFYADVSKSKVEQIIVYKPGYFQNITRSTKNIHSRVF